MKFILLEKKDRLGIIKLNRAEKRNALNGQVVEELKQAFTSFENDDEVKVIILRASGTVFSAGADLHYLQELQQFSYAENLQDSNNLKDLYLQIYNLKKVVIAEIQGHAIAGGCGLMTVCDYAFSVPEAKFGYTEVKIGFIPAIVMVFLLRKLSEGHAKALLLGGHLISANYAYKTGLINEIISPDELTNFTESFAKKLVESNSESSMSLTKKLISNVQGMTLEDALKLATETNATVRESEDCKKGIKAFLQGDEINW